MAESAELDAHDILNGPAPVKTIHSVDDYQSTRYQQCLDTLVNEIAKDFSKRTGLPINEFQKLIRNAPSDIKANIASLLHTANFEYHAIMNFALSGKKTFYFSDNLSHHLANTEINLKADLVELPFNSCLFVFTSPVVINAMHNIRGQDGRWEMNTAGLDYSAPVSVFLTMHPRDRELPARKLVMVAWHARHPGRSYLMLKRELYMGDGWTLEQALRTDWEKLNPEQHGGGIYLSAEGEIATQDDRTFYTDGLGFYRIVLNAILYLSSDQPELFAVKSPRAELEARAAMILSAPKRKKAKKGAVQHSVLDYSEVGGSVSHIIVQQTAVEGCEPDGNAGSRSKSLYKFMVRGHWRHQPYGPGLSERKLIWIKPFYKGEDMASQINKPYLVR